MIDIRSDTVTTPTPEMREIIANARVGDDVYKEDPTINELEEYVADLLGKDAAIFVPSGTMSNQIALAAQNSSGEEVIIEADAHVFYYETAAPSLISRVLLRAIPSEKGMMPLEEIEKAIRPDIYFYPRTSMICLENTHNRHSGAIIEPEYIDDVRKICDDNDLKLHLDGARLWNACVAKNITPKVYSRHFDSISVCLSKGLGAPVGSLLVGSCELIKKALKWRKILGGGMRQAGILAAAGLYALKNNYKLLENDHKNAQLFAQTIDNSEFISVDIDAVETNMVYFKYSDKINDDELIKICKDKGLVIYSLDKNTIRVVFHFQVTEKQTIEAANIIVDSINYLANK